MQRNVLLAVGVVGVAGLGSAGAIANGAQVQDATVSVDVRCRGNNEPTWTVTPDTVTIERGQGITWSLAVNGNGNTVEVFPKQGQRPWPFPTARPTGNRQNPARSGGSNAAGHWRYNIQVVCQQGNNPPRTVDIDPDIIITPDG
jgi:hypothetical protein